MCVNLTEYYSRDILDHFYCSKAHAGGFSCYKKEKQIEKHICDSTTLTLMLDRTQSGLIRTFGFWSKMPSVYTVLTKLVLFIQLKSYREIQTLLCCT